MKLPRLHPALSGLVMAVFLFAFLIVFDLLVLDEPLADVWQGALLTAVVVSAFHAMFVRSARRRAAENPPDEPRD